jgi:hypothetical protein
MQVLIDILGIVCLALAGCWIWFKKKKPRVSLFSLIAFFVVVVVTMVLAYFLKH